MALYHGLFFIVFLVLVQNCRGEYGDRIKNATETWGPNLEMQESRYYDHYAPRPRTELPVNFQAPYINAKDYWTEQPRRTIFNYDSPFSQDIITRPLTEGINSFYGLMNQFFGSEEPPPKRKPNYPNYPKNAPYEFEQQPFYKQPPRPQYVLNPNKPLRASVIKLEPNRPPAQFGVPPAEFTTAKYYPQFVKILNDVLIENSYKNQLATLGLIEDPTVLEKPEIVIPNIIPTTYKPKKKPVLQKTTPFPESIQDQLPPIKTGQDTQIPYVPEGPTTTRTTGTTTGTNMVFHDSPAEVPGLDIDIDVRSAATLVATTPSSPITFPTPKRTPTTSRVVFETTTNGETGLRVPFESTLTTRRPIVRETATPELPLQNESTATNTEVTTEEANSQPEPITGVNSLLEITTVAPTEQQRTSLNVTIEVSSDIKPVTEVPIITVTPKRTEEVTTTTELDAAFTTTTTPEVSTTAASDIATPAHLLSQSSENRPVITDLIQTMENLGQSRFSAPFPKKLDNRRVTTDATNSADYVTDLTLRGLAEDNGKFNIHSRHVSTVVNMSTVVGFELAKLNGTAPPFSRNSFLDLEDELSLDARILKDTNWDGFQPPIPITPRKMEEKESIVESLRPTAPPIYEMLSTTTVFPTTTFQPPTTTETDFTTLGTTESSTTVQPNPTAAENTTTVISTRVTKTVTRSRKAYTRTPGRSRTARIMKLPNFDDKFTIGAFITEASKEAFASATPRPRKYQRRVKVQAFTPYPTQLNETDSAEKPLKLGTHSRPFYPKRSRPNVTLTFSNGQASKRMDSQEGESERSTTRRSAGPRKDLYKRRSYPSQLRRRTTEETLIQEE